MIIVITMLLVGTIKKAFILIWEVWLFISHRVIPWEIFNTTHWTPFFTSNWFLCLLSFCANAEKPDSQRYKWDLCAESFYCYYWVTFIRGHKSVREFLSNKSFALQSDLNTKKSSSYSFGIFLAVNLNGFRTKSNSSSLTPSYSLSR